MTSDLSGDSTQKEPENKQLWIAFACVVAVTFFCFAPDLKNALLEWDDSSYITYNENIRSLSYETVRWAFVEFYTNYWAPLTWLSYAVDYAFWGVNPVGYHLTNNSIHAINAGLFFLLSIQLLSIAGFGSDAKTVKPESMVFYSSLLAALIFAVHPLRVESVAWAAERKDVLSMFFGIASVLAYVRFTRPVLTHAPDCPKRFEFISSTFFWLSLALYCCSLLSKSILVTLPVVLLIMDWFPFRRVRTFGWQRLVIEKLPFLLCAFMATLYTITAHKQYGSIMPLEDADMFSRTLLALKGILAYLWLTFWPLDISPFYVHPGNIKGINFEYAMALLFFIAVSSFSLLKVRARPMYFAVWSIYLITLFPVLGFVKGGNEGIAARFSYVPSLPISILIAVVIVSLIANQSYARRMAFSFMMVAVLMAMAMITVRHISFWTDDVALWTRVVDLQPHATGRAYFQRAKALLRIKEYPRALADVNEALTIATRKQIKHLYTIYGTRAEILKGMGDNVGALADFSNAIASATATHSPSLPQYYYMRGTLHQEMGNQVLADEDLKQAQIAAGGR